MAEFTASGSLSGGNRLSRRYTPMKPTQKASNAPQGGQILGVGYPVAAAQNYRGAKPKSAPSTISLAIVNSTAETKIVPLFNVFHQNDEANAIIQEEYNRYMAAKTGATGYTSSLSEVIKNYDPEKPVEGISVKPVNGKPLEAIYRELQSMTTLIDGVTATSDNTSNFNEAVRIEYADWDGSKDSVIKDLSEYKDRYAADSTEIDAIDLAFYLDGRGTLFVSVVGNSKLNLKFKTKYHYNRLVWQ